MLYVYGWNVCPHCRKAVKFLKEHRIPYEYREIEEQPAEVVAKVVEVNGGDDWVVPTLEYNGKWAPGEAFNERRFTDVLKELGIL